MSTTRHLKDSDKEVYNLDWTDLNDSGSAEIQLGSGNNQMSDPADDLDLQIDNDQFDLASLNSSDESKVETPRASESDDEDYDWFVGEIKKEIEGEPARPEQKNINSTEQGPPAKSDSSKKDDIQFEDFGSIEKEVFTSAGAKPDIGNTAKSPGPAYVDLKSPELSENDISKIADKVAEKLASALAAGMDRNTIIEAVKSVLKK